MHSIASVRSSSGAAEYFANDNYYTADEHAEAGVWGGEGARALGLEGQVERDQFEAILNGRLPTGEMVGQVEGRRLGLDLTFSMPKSASILALVSGDKRILDAHLAAVKSVRHQNIWHRSVRKLAECGPRLGIDVRRRACGAASADVRWSVA